MIPALGIFTSPNKNPLPWDSYDANRAFWTTSIVPMGGHIVVERLQCQKSGGDTGNPPDIRVRVLVNEKVQGIPGCKGAGETCLLDEFERLVKGRWKKSFCETCAMTYVDCVDDISFFEAASS